MREERFIAKVVEMHYKQGMSQQEIGKALNVSRPTVSRALTKAKKEGYVEIKINHLDGSRIRTEEVLEDKFHLKEAIIASKRKDEDLGDTVAFYASDYLLRIIKSHMTLTMSRGVTLQKMLGCLERDVRRRFLKLEGVNVVPMEGATSVLTTVEKKYRLAFSNYMSEETARLLNGNGYQLLVPQVVSSAEVKKTFINEKDIKYVLDMAANADVAMMGIGTVEKGSGTVNALVEAETIPKEDYERLVEKGGVGEINGCVVDKDGNEIDDPIRDRLISMELEKLKKIPTRVGVAYGMGKANAILSVLKGGYINVLITDEEVADFLRKAET